MSNSYRLDSSRLGFDALVLSEGDARHYPFHSSEASTTICPSQQSSLLADFQVTVCLMRRSGKLSNPLSYY